MPINYKKLSELRERLIEESKDDVPRMEMYNLYMLAEMRLQSLIMAYYGKKTERFIDITGKEVNDLIEGVNKSIEAENAKKT